MITIKSPDRLAWFIESRLLKRYPGLSLWTFSDIRGCVTEAIKEYVEKVNSGERTP